MKFKQIASLLSVCALLYAASLHGAASLPTPGSDAGTWGTKLNEFLLVGHEADGTLDASAISTGTVPTARLGSGTASSTSFLRGDQTWAIPAAAGADHVFSYQVENLLPGDDIGDGTAANARSVFIAPAALTVAKISIISQGTPAGIDNSNTLVVKAYRGTNLIVTKTYNTGTVFPADHGQGDLGSLSNNVFTAGEDLRIDSVGGATANPPSFMVQVEYDY